MAIKIFTDSCSDMPESMAKELEVTVLPLIYTIDDESYYDDFGKSMAIEEFYEKVSAGSMPSTSLVNTQRYMDAFTPVLERGDDILYLGFSSVLSGSYQCSLTATNELKGQFPNRRIETIDSKCASFGEGLYVYKVVQKLREGVSYDQLYTYAKDVCKTICHFFTVDDLDHLRRGGRLSSLSAVVGSALKIKPVLHVSDEGKLMVYNKQRGRKKAIAELVAQMKERVSSDTKQTIFINHGDCIDDAKLMGSLVVDTFENISADDIVYSFIGPVIGAHAGPRTLALYFAGTHR